MRAQEFLSEQYNLDPATRRTLQRMSELPNPGTWLNAEHAYAIQLGLQQKFQNRRSWEQDIQRLLGLYQKYFGNQENNLQEINRRGFMQGVAGATVLPKKALLKSLMPAKSVAGSVPASWIWTRVGDALDQQHLTNTVNLILRNYRFIALANNRDWPDETAIKTKLHQVLRKHVPGMGPSGLANKKSNTEWNALMKDLQNVFPMPKLPADLPDLHADANEWQAWLDDNPTVDEDKAIWMAELQGLKDGLHQGLAHLAKVTRDANLGDTENYGYKVNHKIKTGEIKPVDYRKPQTSAAAQTAQTVATQIPRGAVASALGSATTALKNLGRKTKDYVVGKTVSSIVPSATKKPESLPAPTNDTEFMRDLTNKMSDLEKEKAEIKK